MISVLATGRGGGGLEAVYITELSKKWHYNGGLWSLTD